MNIYQDKLTHINILGVNINATTMAEAISTVHNWIAQNECQYVCFATVHGIMECQNDEDLLRIYNSSGLTVPDGMPLVWIGNMQGFSSMGRVYGPDFMLELCRTSIVKNYTHFLYGGNPGVTEDLKQYLENKFPGIKIVGTFTPPFRPLTPNEENQLIEQVARTKPDIFWVGLSTTKQEKFMDQYLPKLNAKVMLAVGAAFDFHTGQIQDAPAWIKVIGMQWLHRLAQEPKRLWRRYLLYNPLFIYKIMLQLLTGKRNKKSMTNFNKV